MKKRELQQKLDALVAAEAQQLERLKDVGLEGDEETEYNARRERIEELEEDLKRVELAEKKIRDAEALAAQKQRAGNRQPAQVHNNEQDRPWENVGTFLQAVMNATTRGMQDPRLLQNLAPLGGNVATPGEGGFLVQEDFRNTLLTKAFEASTLANRCTEAVLGDGVNKTSIPYVVENTRATGTRNGGLRAYWGNEASTMTASGNPQIKRIELAAEKLYCLTYMSEEQMTDAAGITSYVNRVVPEEFAFTIDDAILNGDGTAKPLGILNSPCLLSITKHTGQAAATFIRENVEAMWVALWGRSRPNAVWLYNQEMEPQFNQLVLEIGTGGVPVYIPPGTYGVNGQPSLKGRPMIPIEQCAALGTVGDIVLADLSQYLLVKKGALRADSSMHVQFLTDQTAFRWITRINGQPLWESALTPYKGSRTYSPMVALATRA